MTDIALKGAEADNNEYHGKCRRPCNNLYIYLVEGDIGEAEERRLGNNFMGNWVEGGDNFLFFSKPADNEVRLLKEHYPEAIIRDRYDFSYEQWQGLIPDRLRVGRFNIYPPWINDSAKHDMIPLILDPGLVFGTGLHPTTRHCLEVLCLAYEKDSFNKVIDLGTGTGILAIAASFLGAVEVIAVDINPLCVKTARRNVNLNRLESSIRVIKASAEQFVDEKADLVLANLHYDVLIRLLENKDFRRKRAYILSGLMRTQARQVLSLVQRHGFKVLGQWDHEMTWFTIFFN